MRVYGCKIVDSSKDDSKHLQFDSYEIKGDLDSMHEFVGGYIENVCLCSFSTSKGNFSVDLICNEEGKMLDLLPTISLSYGDNVFDVVMGQFFICLGNDDTGEYESLPNDIIKILERLFDCNCFMVSYRDRLLFNLDFDLFNEEVSLYAENEKASK